MTDAARDKFVTSLFEVGDELSGALEDLHEPADLLRAHFVVELLLQQIPPAHRKELLLSAIDTSTGMVLPVQFVRLQLDRIRRDSGALLSRDDLDELRQLLLSRIAARAYGGELLSNRHCVWLLFWWETWDSEVACGWVEEQAATALGLTRLLTAFEGHARQDKHHPLIAFLDLESARANATKWLNDPATTEEERALLKGFLKYGEH